MTKITRTRRFSYPVATLYATLTRPETLAAIVRRIEEIQIVEWIDDHRAEVRVKLDLPARKFIETTGEVQGIPEQQLTFYTREPFPLTFMWTLTPFENAEEGQTGTEVISSLEIDIRSFVAVFSGVMLQGLLAAELEADFDRLEKWLAESG